MGKKIAVFLAVFCCAAVFAQNAQPKQVAPAVQPKQAASGAESGKRFIAVYITGVTGDKERRVLGNEILSKASRGSATSRS